MKKGKNKCEICGHKIKGDVFHLDDLNVCELCYENKG